MFVGMHANVNDWYSACMCVYSNGCMCVGCVCVLVMYVGVHVCVVWFEHVCVVCGGGVLLHT